MIKFYYSTDDNIIYVKRTDEISLKDLFEYILAIDENFNGLNELRIVDDLTNSVRQSDEDDYSTLINEIKKRLIKYTKVKHAVIVNAPTETALSFLFQDTAKELNNYIFRAFCTFEAGKTWVTQDFDD
jgi:hypothetical protein